MITHRDMLHAKENVVRTAFFAAVVCAFPLPLTAFTGAPITFDLTYDGSLFGNSAAGTGFITFDQSILPIPGGLINRPAESVGVLDFSLTISGASSGNGTFGMSDNPNWIWNVGENLDRSVELVGQPHFFDFNLGLTGGSSTRPRAVNFNTIEAGGRRLGLSSMNPRVPVHPVTTRIFDTVALSGEQAQGLPPGVRYASFPATPVINNVGQVAFGGLLEQGSDGVTAENDSVLMTGAPDSLSVLVREGAPTPGVPVTDAFTQVDDLRINDSGEVSGLLTFQRGGTNTSLQGIGIGGPGSFEVVAYVGEQAAGAEAGVNFGGTGRPPSFNGNGQIFFMGGLTGVDADDPGRAAMWSGDTQSLVMQGRAFRQAPGVPEDAMFWSFNLAWPAISDSGKIAIAMQLRNGSGGVTQSNDSGIWMGGAGLENSLALLFREGDRVPNSAPGTRFGHFHDPLLNESGHILFANRLQPSGGVTSANDDGIWSNRSGSLEEIVREGSPAPGVGMDFGRFSLRGFNDRGDVFFSTRLLGEESNRWSFWVNRDGDFHLVAREGFQVPGAPVGTFIDRFGQSAFTNTSQVAFRAILDGPGVTDSNDEGLFMTSSIGELTMLAREGDLVQIAPNDLRTIDELSMAHGFDQSGRSSGFNDLGQLVFHLSFDDGSSGIFWVNPIDHGPTVPEPSAMGLAVCGLISLCAIARRRRKPA